MADSKRFMITLNPWVGRMLENWAEYEETKPASLISFLIEKAVREEVASGRVRDVRSPPGYKSLRHLILDNLDRLSKDKKLKPRLETLLEGETPTELDRLRICLNLGLSEVYIDSLKGDKKNGNPKSTV